MESRLERLRLDMEEGKPILKKGGGQSAKEGRQESKRGVASPTEDSADQSEEEEGMVSGCQWWYFDLPFFPETLTPPTLWYRWEGSDGSRTLQTVPHCSDRQKDLTTCHISNQICVFTYSIQILRK